MSDSDSDIKDDTTTSFAVMVPQPPPNPTVVRDYLRLGDVDKTYEGNLIDPTDGSSDTKLSTQAGALIYSTENVTLVAPTITQVASYKTDWSGESLSVVGTGLDYTSATYTGGAAAEPLSTTYQKVNDFNTIVGTTTNLLTGNGMTQWLGNDASTGLGTLLWSNFGHTQNIFGGQIVNIVNNAIDVQGFGENKLATNYSVGSVGSISLQVSPLAAATGAGLVRKFPLAVGIISAAAQTGLNTLSAAEAGIAGMVDGPDVMKKNMIAVTAEIAAASACILIMQAMAIAAGLSAVAISKATVAAGLSGITITPNDVTIRVAGSVWCLDAAGLNDITPVRSHAAASVSEDSGEIAFQ